MWYACSIASEGVFENPPISLPAQLADGIRLELIPDWVKSDNALSLLSWNDREKISRATVTFAAEYEAEALGSPDPEWRGTPPRGIQSAVDEKFALASVALWLAKPSRLSCGPVLHFGKNGDPASLRQAGSMYPILVAESESENVPTNDDLKLAGRLLDIILCLDRKGTTWTAMSMMYPALRERLWELRYLLEWVVLEALFGPESPNETTYRLAQRIAFFVGENSREKRRLFDQAKDAYSWRSKIVHGRRLTKLTGDKSLELSSKTEDALRRAFKRILLTPAYLTQFDGKERDRFLDELMFS